MTNLIEVVRAYLAGIEAGDLQQVLSCYDAAAEQVEWPNRLKAKGDHRNVHQLGIDFEKGKALLTRQSYEILHHAEADDYVLVEVLWKGTLAVTVGKLSAGEEMVAHSAIAFNFRNGLIIAQRNYDCFEPF